MVRSKMADQQSRKLIIKATLLEQKAEDLLDIDGRLYHIKSEGDKTLLSAGDPRKEMEHAIRTYLNNTNQTPYHLVQTLEAKSQSEKSI
jgi:hypothetical protein